MERKRSLNLIRQARETGPYDEYPVLPAKIDPQLHLSRSDRPQPFHLICEHDTVIALLAGEAAVHFKSASVRYHKLRPGDFVYVPAGTPSRIVCDCECVHVRFKPRDAGWEGAAWYCEGCGEELWREEWDTGEVLSQEGYWRSCKAFNDNENLRRCNRCGLVAPPIALDGFRWREVAAELRAASKAQ